MKRLYQEAASGSAAAPGPKRPNENDGSDELMCSICFDLAVDAVQVSCCGALHCRACISKCTACPMCRNPCLLPFHPFRIQCLVGCLRHIYQRKKRWKMPAAAEAGRVMVMIAVLFVKSPFNAWGYSNLHLQNLFGGCSQKHNADEIN